MIENLHQLTTAVRALREGYMFKIPKADLKTFWPDPRSVFEPDDHLSVEERAGKWASAHDVTVNVEIDPPALRVFKPYTIRPRTDYAPSYSNSSEEFGSQEHSVIMDAILGRGDY